MCDCLQNKTLCQHRPAISSFQIADVETIDNSGKTEYRFTFDVLCLDCAKRTSIVVSVKKEDINW